MKDELAGVEDAMLWCYMQAILAKNPNEPDETMEKMISFADVDNDGKALRHF